MRIEQLLPEEAILPAVGTALERGNAALAVAIVADELDACDRSDATTLVQLLVQGALSARFAGHGDQAVAWSEQAVAAAVHADAGTKILAHSVRVFTVGLSKSREWLASEVDLLDTLMVATEKGVSTRFGEFAKVYASIIIGDIERARTALAQLRATLDSHQSSAWISARAQVCEAVIEYLDAKPDAADAVVA